MASMKAANRLKVAFDEAKAPALGCWQMIPGSNVARTLARTGVDWVLVDCEHGNIDGECSGDSLRRRFSSS
jgi:4-hydroxy-2-oxoheptanedioate aldolase